MTLLRKHIGWLVLAMLAGVAGALAIHASIAPRYTSAAEVDIEPNMPALTIQYAPNMVTEQAVATSGVVLARAARVLGTTTTALQKELSAAVTGTSATGGAANVLSISCSMPTAPSAQQCAAAAAGAYMGYRNETGQPAAKRARDPMVVTLVTPATLPTTVSGVGPKILLPIGAILGLALGIGAVFLRDYSDHRVRDSADLERLLDAPVLAVIPRADRGRSGLNGKQPVAESYRYLREHLSSRIAAVPDGGAVLLIAGARADDGSTSVAAHLAVALAESGAKVLLVEADLARPTLAQAFSAGRRPGWRDLLARRASIDEVAVQVPGVPGLRLVTAGDPAIKPADLIRDSRLSQAILDMRAQADVIVVACAPVLKASHTIALARGSDIVTIVADVRCTSREDASAAVREIRAVGPRVIIGALNGRASSANRRARPVPVQEETLVPAAGAPAILASAVPVRGPNGQHKQPSRAAQGGRGDTEASTDDGPAS